MQYNKYVPYNNMSFTQNERICFIMKDVYKG